MAGKAGVHGGRLWRAGIEHTFGVTSHCDYSQDSHPSVKITLDIRVNRRDDGINKSKERNPMTYLIASIIIITLRVASVIGVAVAMYFAGQGGI
jgi:hypothetical protein